MRKVATFSVILLTLVLSHGPCLFAQGYPDRPINLIISMAPGDGVDVSGRLVADELARLLKVSVVPVNKPGAAGGIGTDIVAKARNDGYTLLLTPSASIIYNKVLHPQDVSYDSFKDLTPLGLSTISPALMVVRSDAPYKDFKEMIEYAKKNPGKIRCGTPGVGTVSDFDMEIIKALTGVSITVVPFKGASPAVTAILGGHVDAVVAAIGPLISHVRSGKTRGVLISDRFPDLPDVPTLKQLGYPQDILGIWFAFFGPSGIPAQVKETLVLAIEKAVRDPAIFSKVSKLGMIQEFEPPKKLYLRMQEEYKMVDEIAKRAGMAK